MAQLAPHLPAMRVTPVKNTRVPCPVSRAGAACLAEQRGGWCACTPPAPSACRVPRDSEIPRSARGRCRALAGAEAWSASSMGPESKTRTRPPLGPSCRPGPGAPGLWPVLRPGRLRLLGPSVRLRHLGNNSCPIIADVHGGSVAWRKGGAVPGGHLRQLCSPQPGTPCGCHSRPGARGACSAQRSFPPVDRGQMAAPPAAAEGQAGERDKRLRGPRRLSAPPRRLSAPPRGLSSLPRGLLPNPSSLGL